MNNTKTNTKLTIQDISMYLPYGLKMLFEYTNYIGTLTEIHNREYETHPTKLVLDYQSSQHIWMFKPILKPLSQLHEDKELIEKIFDLSFNKSITENKRKFYVENGNKVINASHYSTSMNLCIIKNEPKFNPQYINDELIKAHYDINNLIPQGLAISTEDIKEKVYG